jgi:hypothetical protein
MVTWNFGRLAPRSVYRHDAHRITALKHHAVRLSLHGSAVVRHGLGVGNCRVDAAAGPFTTSSGSYTKALTGAE